MKDTHITKMKGEIQLIEIEMYPDGTCSTVGKPFTAKIGDGSDGIGYAFPAGDIMFDGQIVWLWHYLINEELDTIYCINNEREDNMWNTKKIDFSKLEGRVLDEILEYMEESNCEAPTTAYEALDMFLKWNGIIGYTAVIQRAIHEIEAAGVEPIEAEPTVEKRPILAPAGPGAASLLNELIQHGQKVWCNDYTDGAKALKTDWFLRNDGAYYLICNVESDLEKRSHHQHFFVEME